MGVQIRAITHGQHRLADAVNTVLHNTAGNCSVVDAIL